MSSTTDKMTGVGNQIAGKAKQAAGDLAGDAKLRQEGLAQERTGHLQQAVGDAKDKVKSVIDKA
jgi:uncharacterized protein YjbJ (UPF0337 family)